MCLTKLNEFDEHEFKFALIIIYKLVLVGHSKTSIPCDEHMHWQIFNKFYFLFIFIGDFGLLFQQRHTSVYKNYHWYDCKWHNYTSRNQLSIIFIICKNIYNLFSFVGWCQITNINIFCCLFFLKISVEFICMIVNSNK